MDTNPPHRKWIFNLFGALAQYERALIRERVQVGLEAARRQGQRGGRAPQGQRAYGEKPTTQGHPWGPVQVSATM
ncbi:recombinase family protein [Nitrosococcus wardiae]|uniref:recombinase family protein n=1 Tax=Nitrosococcus wardiae TaxID=1814290 RepID=UPI0023EA4CD2|nr:recombinase family protein [Nitrosococcus wardiae]